MGKPVRNSEGKRSTPESEMSLAWMRKKRKTNVAAWGNENEDEARGPVRVRLYRALRVMVRRVQILL